MNGRLFGGRKKGAKATHTLEAEKFRKYLINRVVKEKKAIVDSLIKNAKDGDTKAIQEILDRTMGRPTQSFEGRLEGLEELGAAIRQALTPQPQIDPEPKNKKQMGYGQ